MQNGENRGLKKSSIYFVENDKAIDSQITS